jgi:hypothetical protein
MRLQAVLDAPCGPETLFPWVADLSRYPSWLDLITSVTVLGPSPSAAAPTATGTRPAGQGAAPSEDLVADAWSVVLSARIGPFRRSKRLRMVRTVYEPPLRARFERAEDDGRDHAAWSLDARVEPGDPPLDRPDHGRDGQARDRGVEGVSRLRMDLSYDGRLWGPLVERVLEEHIEASRPRLVALVSP